MPRAYSGFILLVLLFRFSSLQGAEGYVLKPVRAIPLTSPDNVRFDASALIISREGSLWTLNDRGPVPYRIRFDEDYRQGTLESIPAIFTESQLAPFAAEKRDRYDCEGLALDDSVNIYICEEANRWILRYDPSSQKVERLEIDWSPVTKYFDPQDSNASFEGVAVGRGKLYVANERNMGRIMVVDLASLKIIDDFTVTPSMTASENIHYSDLCWFKGSLYALLRHNHAVIRINPDTHQILSEYSYRETALDPAHRYHSKYPTGVMEGLAVDDNFIYLVTDNNGDERVNTPGDTRPLLLICPRPDRKK